MLQDRTNDRFVPLLIAVGAFLFYLPFLSRQFIGDDWLWLFNAKAAWQNPLLYFERSMYGYFRPLNMLVVSIWLKLFGINSYLFSLVNILLHATNVLLLWRVLKRLGAPQSISTLSAFIFAFYMLNAPAIEWISVGHDLWVTLLCLLFTLRVITFTERPTNVCFIQVLILGLAATLFKESGFVSIGLYFLLLILKSKNPLSRKYRLSSIIFIAVYLVYLILYFQTRTIADKELVFGIDTIVNLWFFLVYLSLPYTARMVQMVPDQLLWLLSASKIVATIAVPLLMIYFIKRGNKVVRFFALWSVMFISTIAIFKWEISLFTLFPPSTASRFMYTSLIGFSVVTAWLVVKVYEYFKQYRVITVLRIVFVATFIVGNLFATWQLSKLYFSSYKMIDNIIQTLGDVADQQPECESIIVYYDHQRQVPQFVRSGKHLKAVLDVLYNLQREVIYRDVSKSSPQGKETSKAFLLIWDADTQKLRPLTQKDKMFDFR